MTVLRETRALVARPDNDFSWSTWDDADEALAELDAAIASLARTGRVPAVLRLFFLPTGPLQELALSSGWADEYLALADRFDEAVAEAS